MLAARGDHPEGRAWTLVAVRPLAYRHQPDIDLRRSLSRPRLGRRSSYTDQLEALRSYLRDGTPSPRPDDALDTMRLIDACCYAGFGPAPCSSLPSPDRTEKGAERLLGAQDGGWPDPGGGPAGAGGG
jgi:hypothetical protein